MKASYLYILIFTFSCTSNTLDDESKKLWNKISPNFPFEFHFLDDTWNSLYKKDRMFQKIMSLATLIAILLSCLGLVGFSYFIIDNRTKEIGIRKVNGAKETDVVIMLNRDLVKWVIIAFIISIPITWYSMNKWLDKFAFRTEIDIILLVLAGLLALLIALITVIFHTYKSASANPVEALKYE